MRSLSLSILFLSIVFPVLAQADFMIITGAFYTKKQADSRVLSLKEVMSSQRNVSKLQNEIGFDYVSKRSGRYYIAAIEPFSSGEDVRAVLAIVRMAYPDAYTKRIAVKLRRHRVEAGKPIVKAEVVKKAESGKPVVKAKAAEKVTAEKEEALESEAKNIEEEVVEIVEESSPVELEKTSSLQPSRQEQDGESMSNTILYAIIAVVIILFIIFVVVLSRKGRKKPPELKEIVVEGSEKVVSKEIPVKKAAQIFEPVKEPAVEQKTEKPDAGIVLPSKKREYKATTKVINKESLAEFSGSRILVAEDNTINQKVILKTFEGSGIEVVIVDNGQEALDTLKNDKDFQIILMDAHMPIMDGFEATRQIRSNPAYEHIVVVALSGDVGSDDIRKMREAGMQEQLAKPLNIENLYRVIYEYTDAKKAKVAEQEALQVETKPSAVADRRKKSAASPRKKREPVKHKGAITKDNLAEFSGKRVLMAEDNMINQKVVSKLLEDSGMETVIVDNGQAALDLLAKDSDFEIVLMDAHMPIMDGFEATRQIRSNPAYEHIVVVALSGDVGSDDIRKMREAGMEEQLAKPLRVEALYDIMYSYFSFETGDEAVSQKSAKVLDVEEGLYIAGDHMQLYKEILDEFVDEYGESDTDLQNYFAEGDMKSANGLLLDVRGIAGNIGAMALLRIAEELRDAVINSENEKQDTLLKEYKEQLRMLLLEIKKV